MKHILLLAVLLITSIAFAKGKKNTVDEQVTEMVAYLGKFSQIKEAFPEKMEGVSENTRKNVATIIKGFGSEKIPYMINFKNVIRSYSADGEKETIEFYSFEPLAFNYNGEDFKYKSTEDFLDAVARMAPKKTVYNIFVEQAFAKAGKYLLAAGAGYVAGRSSGSSPQGSTTIHNSTTVSTAVTVNNPDKVTVQSSAERDKAERESQMEALATSVADSYPDVTCNKDNEKFIPNATVSYRKENNVTIVKFNTNGISNYLEWRQNHVEQNTTLVFCEAGKPNCQKTNFDETEDHAIGEKLDHPVRRAQINAEAAKIDDLISELQKERREYLNSSSLDDETTARVKFIKSRKINYPKISKCEDLDKALDSRGGARKAYDIFLKSIDADSPFSKAGVEEKAKALLRSFSAMSFSEFYPIYMKNLGVHGYKQRKKEKKRFPEDQWKATTDAINQLIKEEKERLRPFELNYDCPENYLLLTAEHEKEFQVTQEQRKAGLKEEKAKNEVAARAFIAKVREHLKLKPGQSVGSCGIEKNIR
jgi:hypothetical protein